jgi:hypothetical protein
VKGKSVFIGAAGSGAGYSAGRQVRRVQTCVYSTVVAKIIRTTQVRGVSGDESEAAFILFPRVPKSGGRGRRLYAAFRDYARAHGCQQIKAITTLTNASSVAFHRGLGMRLLGEEAEGGIPFVRDYGGPGQHRVVFLMNI